MAALPPPRPSSTYTGVGEGRQWGANHVDDRLAAGARISACRQWHSGCRMPRHGRARIVFIPAVSPR